MNAPLALHKRENSFLASAARTDMLARAAMLVLLKSAHKRFVHLDGLAFPAKQTRFRLTQAFADTVHQEP